MLVPRRFPVSDRDVGLHAFRWTRPQAIEYFAKYCAMGQTDIEAEIDRYMVLPGQALSYKVYVWLLLYLL